MGFNNNILNYDLTNLQEGCLGEDFNKCCRKAAADGIVLLKNDNLLPLDKSKPISVFGRIQNYYYKSGTGSGGLVNVKYNICLIEALRNNGIIVDEELAARYENWNKNNPMDFGQYWYNEGEPWSQEEMPLSEDVVARSAAINDTAIAVIGRTAGEGTDNKPVKSSWYLSDKEEEMLSFISKHFKKYVVILNVSNIIDMSWIDKYNPDAVMYIWQGGQEGANACADVLTGNVNPSGKLTDTIAYTLEDYPSYDNFGSEDKIYYEEDIFVGYRYFNTFAEDKIRYPFGFGLSYTDFSVEAIDCQVKIDAVTVKAKVKNVGKIAGKEVVQVYYSAPQGKLGKPKVQLATFAKTKMLVSGESQILTLTFELKSMASFDDMGLTGQKSCFVLEAGDYEFYIGRDSLDIKFIAAWNNPELTVTERCSSALPLTVELNRYKSEFRDNRLLSVKEKSEFCEKNYKFDNEINKSYYATFTGDNGIKLTDVKYGKNTMEEFISQLTDKELISLSLGEGMCSPKTTPGVAGAVGGLSKSLVKYNIPIVACADGPSGIRLDSGSTATSIPIGTLLASTWDCDLVEEIYTYLGIEMVANRIDILLGPGMNIHRCPLCGRNFEYYSEDPTVTGIIASAAVKGIKKAGVTACIKHFAANNQEFKRAEVNSVVSERALREIYLKGFETVVKGGCCDAVMTAYNSINGIHCSSSYDLNEIILRKEWGFKGIVMTDWWATNEDVYFENKSEDKMRNLATMSAACNDVYMVCSDSTDYNHNNLLTVLNNNSLSRSVLAHNCANICNLLMNSRAMERFERYGSTVSLISLSDTKKMNIVAHYSEGDIKDGILLNCAKEAKLVFKFRFTSTHDPLTQRAAYLYVNGNCEASFAIKGTGDGFVEEVRVIHMKKGNNHIKVSARIDSISTKEITVFN